MITYEYFYKEYVTRKISDVGKIHTNLAALPREAVVHVLDNLRETPEDGRFPMLPNTSGLLYGLHPDNKKLLYSQTQFVEGAWPLASGRMMPITVKYPQAIRALKSNSNGLVKLVDSFSDFQYKPGYTNIINYNALFNVKVTGTLRTVRLVNNLLASVLNNCAKIPEAQHFIHVPLTGVDYTKQDFVKTNKALAKQNIMYRESMHYLALVHLMSFIDEKSESSPINTLSNDVLQRCNFVLEYENKFIIYRLDILKELNADGALVVRIINHINDLHSTGASITADTISPDGLVPKPNATGINSTVFAGDKSPEEKRKSNEDLTKATLDLAKEKIVNDTTLSPKQKAAALANLENIQAVTYGNATIGEITKAAVDNKVELNKLDIPGVPDESMTESTIQHLASDYMNKTFDLDMANIMTDFSKVGMIVVDVKIEDDSDALNQVNAYTVIFKDKSGKRHTIRFTLPKVDENGLMFINGQEKHIKLQRVNVPIIKDGPTRVVLNSNYSTTMMHRNASMAHSFIPYMKRLFEKAGPSISTTQGKFDYSNITLPYEYTEFAKWFTTIETANFSWTFDYENRFNKIKNIDAYKEAEVKYGTYLGKDIYDLYFLDVSGTLTIVNGKDFTVVRGSTVIDEIVNACDVKVNPLREWVDIKVLNKKVPLALLMCYKYGLIALLDYMHVNYAKYSPGERVETKHSDIVLRFNDAKLVIKGQPRVASLIFSGLTKYKLNEIDLDEMDESDIYYDLIQEERLSINYLRAMDAFMDMWLDPITADVLMQMNEPTNIKDLLIRATVLLTTSDNMPNASSTKFRYRAYEHLAATVYRSIANAIVANQNTLGKGNRAVSISKYEIMSKIQQDPLVSNVDGNNPISDIKRYSGYSHTGQGGRGGTSMVINDRRFPEDGVGIISESTVDSGNVGIDGMLTSNPSIVNTRGMCDTKPLDELSASDMLSATGLFFPGADQDD